MENQLEQTTCKRCGRKLKNQQAITLGMGTVCWRKYQKENNHKKLFEFKEKKNENIISD